MYERVDDAVAVAGVAREIFVADGLIADVVGRGVLGVRRELARGQLTGLARADREPVGDDVAGPIAREHVADTAGVIDVRVREHEQIEAGVEVGARRPTELIALSHNMTRFTFCADLCIAIAQWTGPPAW